MTPISWIGASRLAALVALLVDLAAAADLHLERLGEGVHDRHADAVQAAGHLVGALVELAAGVQLGEHDLRRRHALGGVDLDRDAAPVVLDRDAGVDVDGHVDAGAVAGQRLVDRVVDDLEHEVMQTALGGVADVHPGPLPDGLEALENLDVLGAVRPTAAGASWSGHHCLAEGNGNVYRGTGIGTLPGARHEPARSERRVGTPHRRIGITT